MTSGVGWRATAWRLATHALALAPLAWLVFDATTGRLSADPIDDIELRTGKPALVLLVLSLACSPAMTVFGWRWAHPLRRRLGLYAFFYALLHFVTFVAVDYSLNPTWLAEAIFEKPYALVGFSAFVILTARRLGTRWTWLHRLVYVAGPLAVVHYAWSLKADLRQPILFGVVVACLLALRLPRVRSAVARARRSVARRPAARITTPPAREPAPAPPDGSRRGVRAAP
jgi:sulfoxide reductase heme-binding subunit YedZ